MPTVHTQIGTSHETTAIAQHEQHWRAEFIHGAQAEQHVVTSPLALHPGLLKRLRRGRGANMPGRERIDSDQGNPHSAARDRASW